MNVKNCSNHLSYLLLVRFLSSGIAGGPQGVSNVDSNVAMASWCMSITMWENGRVCCLLLQYSDMICKKDDDFRSSCTGCCTETTTSVVIYILKVINIAGLLLQITNDAPCSFLLNRVQQTTLRAVHTRWCGNTIHVQLICSVAGSSHAWSKMRILNGSIRCCIDTRIGRNDDFKLLHSFVRLDCVWEASVDW